MARRPSIPWKRGDRVVLYIRVSKVGDRADTLISPDVQIRQGRAWAKREGCVVVDVVQDIDLSGRDIMKRQLREQIERVRRGEVEGIVVWKISRWGRNTNDSLTSIQALHDAKGFIASTSENLEEIETPTGKFSLTMLLAIAQLQSDQIGETWVDILERRRELGLPPNGSPRFGYVRVPQGRDGDPAKEYQPDELTGPWLTRCYEEYVSGTTVARLCHLLNRHGITTTTGKRHTATALLKTLDSGFGAGLLVDRRRNGPGRNHPSVVDYTPGAHEPLIDSALWSAYVKRRKDHKTPPRDKGTNFKLAGLLRCGSCEGKLYVSWEYRRGGVKWRVYRCRKTKFGVHNFDICPAPVSIRLDIAERLTYEWLVDSTSSEAAYESAQAKTAAADRARTDLDRVDAEIAKLKKRIDRVNRTLLDEEDLDEVESMETIKSEAKSQLAALRDQRVDLETLSEDGDRRPVDAVDALLAAWDHADPSVVNTALRDVIRCIVVGRTQNAQRDDARLRIVPTYEEEIAA